MANQVILISKRKYATGLVWQPTATGAASRNYAHTLARSIDKKLNLYTQYRTMIGLGARRVGHKNGMPSAAAEVMESLAEFSSFLGVFKAGEGFWLVAVRNGIIIADKLFASDIDAVDEYQKLAAMPDWNALFAPVSWSMPRSVERNLTEIISGGVHANLRPISRFGTNLVSLVLFGLFVFGVGYFFREPISQILTPKPHVAAIDPALAEEYKKRVEEKNRQLDEQFNIKKAEPAAVQPLAMPYDYLPDVNARAQLCYQAIGFLMQNIPGWNQTAAECNETHVSVTMRRGFGTLADFYNVATDLMPGAYVEEKSESEIFVRAKLPQLATAASLEEKDVITVVRDVNTAFQKIDTPVDVNAVVDVVSNDFESSDVNVVEVGAESKLIPTEFMKIFGDLHGVYMTRCAWTAASRTWNYEVIIYAK